MKHRAPHPFPSSRQLVEQLLPKRAEGGSGQLGDFDFRVLLKVTRGCPVLVDLAREPK